MYCNDDFYAKIKSDFGNAEDAFFVDLVFYYERSDGETKSSVESRQPKIKQSSFSAVDVTQLIQK